MRAFLVLSLKLSIFTGYPKRVGDPTVAELLVEFDMYARHTGVKDVDRAVALLDQLGGCAREEVLCQPERVRQTGKALVALLMLRFGPPETVHSLGTTFHARMQLDSESLADYSRVLIHLHNRMERAAASEYTSSNTERQCTKRTVCSRCSGAVRPPRAETDCFSFSGQVVPPHAG